jgi:hypothetical protein
VYDGVASPLTGGIGGAHFWIDVWLKAATLQNYKLLNLHVQISLRYLILCYTILHYKMYTLLYFAFQDPTLVNCHAT